ncbi:transcriptional antiterminator, BglG family [Lachnospiraceae bacterium]|nr:transcriptional antiterminator, BglG family [Lachnospiraceae bacterium]
MYRITKVLNHNAVITVDEDAKEYLIMEKGIGFGRKIAERIEVSEQSSIYSLQSTTERGEAEAIVKQVDPACLETADVILKEAEKNFGKVDRKILFSLADHLQFAMDRMKKNEKIRNPMTDDIKVLFHAEYKTAETAIKVVRENFGVDITEDEVGYLALHIHSAIEDESVSQAMEIARAVNECIAAIKKRANIDLETTSLGYNRLMNHIRYMLIRMTTGEKLQLDINDYMNEKFPETFAIAKGICDEMSTSFHKAYQEAEIGYLAMHIERVGGSAV